jgi:raffinose/stachyose/melibiose transport system substrate-binding protein
MDFTDKGEFGMAKRKAIALMICAVLTTGLITACGSSGSGSAASGSAGASGASGSDGKKGETAEISWYLHNQSSPEDKKIVDTIVQNFEKAHPDIHVKVSYNADPDAQTKQLLAAGAGPDIVMTDGPSTLKQYAAANYLLPLDDYAKKYGWDKKFDSWAYKTVQYDNHLMGLPGSFETLVVYYNKDMFKENGWEVPTNEAELLSLCQKIQAKGIVPFAFGSSDFKAANEWWLSLAYNETLGADHFKKVLTGEEPWNSDAMAEATTKLVDMWQKGYISNKQSAAITIDNATTLFLSRKAAMKMEGTWLLSNLIDQKPSFDWGMFEMPAWKDGVQANLPLALGDATGINKNTKYPDQVAAFLDYLNSPEVVQMEIPRAQFHPVQGLDVDSIAGMDPHVKEAYQLLKKAIDSNGTGYAAWTYWPPATETYAWGNIESVYYKQTDVKTYLAKCAEQFEKDKQQNKLFDFAE